jgi:hypothetical protein
MKHKPAFLMVAIGVAAILVTACVNVKGILQAIERALDTAP